MGLWLNRSDQLLFWGTLAANVLACFVLGALLSYFSRADTTSVTLKLLFATGFCGGFSTFSTFVAELVHHGQNNQHGEWIGYILFSLAGGVLALLLGNWLGRMIL